MVVATIALFAALGGGYATAFSGSGTVQKGALSGAGIPSASFATARTLTGIGSIQVRCDTTATDMIVRFHNSSGVTLLASNHRTGANGTSFGPGFVDNGDDVDLRLGSVGNDTIRFHIHEQGDKRPQAEVLVTTDMRDACNPRHINVLALNTEE
jgi:hypothetical protein